MNSKHMKRTLQLLLVLTIFAWACSDKTNKSNNNIVTATLSGNDFKIDWKLVTNNYNGREDRNLHELSITNKSEKDINKEWKIYFSGPPQPIDSVFTPDVTIKQLQGDLYVITPQETFPGIKKGESFTFKFTKVESFCIKYSDAPCGFYVVNPTGEASNIEDLNYAPLAGEKQTQRGPGDIIPVMNPEQIFEANESLTSIDDYSKIIPTPVKQRYDAGTPVIVTSDSKISYEDGLADEAEYLQKAIKEQTGLELETVVQKGLETPFNGNILLRLNPDETKFGKIPGPEGYQTFTHNKDLNIIGKSGAGVLYGIQSIRALIGYGETDEIEIPGHEIIDYPRFEYRGLHLDAGRNFHSKESVLKLLEVMSFYKLNKLHFHLTDDEGWRLEIEQLPELTQVGGRRGHTETELDMLQPAYGSGADPEAENNYGSGYYSKSDFIEILKYATERKIEVIPEIDLPGHSRAAIKAMEARYHKYKDTDMDKAEQYRLADPEDKSVYSSVQKYNDNVICPCQQSTYDFLEVVLDEVVGLFEEAGAKLTTIHVGGDEVPTGVWEKSPKCEALSLEEGLEGANDITSHFLRTLSNMLKKRDLNLAGWEETACNRIELEGGHHDYVPNPDFANGHFRPYVWNNVWGWGGETRAYKLANSGYQVVLCNATNLYFDLAYNKDPKEPGYYWAGFGNTRNAFDFTPMNVYNSAKIDRMGVEIPASNYDGATTLTAQGKENILGMQGHLWSESIKGGDSLEYFYMPKILGLAERAWSPRPSWELTMNTKAQEADWNKFANSVGKVQREILDKLAGGINYRIPLVGIKVEDGMVSANVAYPGFEIRYTNDGSDPDMNSSIYTEPLQESKIMKFRAFATTGRGGRVTEK